MKPHRHEEHIQHTFDAFCKKVLRNEARDYLDELARKRNREISFSDLPVGAMAEQQKTNVKAFIAAVKKYTDMQELDATVIRKFIDRIEVSQADRKTKQQAITIVYSFIGAFDFSRAAQEAHNST